MVLQWDPPPPSHVACLQQAAIIYRLPARPRKTRTVPAVSSISKHMPVGSRSGHRNLGSIYHLGILDALNLGDNDSEPPRVWCRLSCESERIRLWLLDTRRNCVSGRLGWRWSICLDEHTAPYQVATDLGPKLGVQEESLRRWIIQAQIDGGSRAGLRTAQREEVRALKRQVRDLEETVEVLKVASVSFAEESGPRVTLRSAEDVEMVATQRVPEYSPVHC